MAKNEKTSKKAASAASKVLRDPKATKEAKSAAGSALTQAPDKKPLWDIERARARQAARKKR